MPQQKPITKADRLKGAARSQQMSDSAMTVGMRKAGRAISDGTKSNIVRGESVIARAKGDGKRADTLKQKADSLREAGRQGHISAKRTYIDADHLKIGGRALKKDAGK
jgi:hypothetical protein